MQVEIIVLTAGPHFGDPLDLAPVLLHFKDDMGQPQTAKLTTKVVGFRWRVWLFRLGIYLVRSYVRRLVEGSK